MTKRCICFTGLLALFLSPVSGQLPGENNRKADSRAPFIHRISILDDDGIGINPNDRNAKPYSPMATCAACHPTLSISHGWHFNATNPDVPPGRPGEPWVYVDATTRSVLPLSYRKWPGAFHPADAGLSDWDMTLLFGRHMPGGSFGRNSTTQPADQADRWQYSGKLEIDCMICHSATNVYDAPERAKQIGQFQNLKWAPTVALGLAHVHGAALALGLDEEEEEEEQEIRLTYDKTCFDPQNKVFFDIVGNPPNARCYFCHSTHTDRSLDPRSPPAWLRDGDVHMVNGLSCTDCHRESILHDTVRAYEGEGALRGELAVATLTCAGCHLGSPEGAPPEVQLGGKLASPIPGHKGLPPIHFEKLSCTACHSGPWPAETPIRVQTSFAHALGLDLPNRNPETLPHIVEPVFLYGEDGKLTPHRALWPNYWGRLEGDQVTLMPPKVVAAAARQVLPRTRETAPEASQPLSREQILKTLEALSQEGQSAAGTEPAPAPPVYISGGKMYRRADDGTLAAAEHPAAQPYTWPLGHDVRAGGQSLGARGCADCHSADAPIYFGTVTPVGPVDKESAATKVMHDMRGEDGAIASAFAGSFRFRNTLKTISFASSAVLAAVLLVYGLPALARVLMRED